MIISNTKSEDAKARDYKIHEENMVELFVKIGQLFNSKGNPFKKETLTIKSDQLAESEVDVFGKAVPFLPKVDKDTMDVLIKIFSGEGVYHDNNDILVLFRQFHSLKYK
jgi:hypothetical protein